MFRDRVEAGRQLAEHLLYLKDQDVVVLGLPRGGVPVAHQVALALDAPLDVIVVRKLGVPYQPELAMGAIGEEGVRIIDSHIVSMAGVSDNELAEVERAERAELDRRAHLFRGGRPREPLQGRVAVIVDDGIATGSTARAAAQVARELGAARVVVATPVAPREVRARLGRDADEVIVVETPEPFYAIGQFYLDFSQTADEEVTAILERASPTVEGGSVPWPPMSADDPPPIDQEVSVTVGGADLGGHLTVPDGSMGTVLFAHGSGSSRHSPRNRHVAEALNRAGLGTLLFDLLTPAEEPDRTNVFDIGLLARRLVEGTGWLTRLEAWPPQPIGYFGASTGAAAALWAVSELGGAISAVVSRGGRPDLAMQHLAQVRSPTLLIVGGLDTVVLDLNWAAQAAMSCENRLDVVPGASHLFEEPGAMDRVALLARDWFVTHFRT
ncbi:MAG TPA: phosphoribosyltransferase family protein [Acidimicrobiia bacterium]|nr:phosphoribosyltransferase family protein [Acidimicrobiia bacterium]